MREQGKVAADETLYELQKNFSEMLNTLMFSGDDEEEKKKKATDPFASFFNTDQSSLYSKSTYTSATSAAAASSTADSSLLDLAQQENARLDLLL